MIIRFGARSFHKTKQRRQDGQPGPRPRLSRSQLIREKPPLHFDPAIDDDVGNPDLEVELDSLGLLFTRLIDDDACQDDAEASNAGFAEVTILSSDSENLPLPKFRQANRKVKFSHPLAYLDPKFLMKTQQHEARRTT